MSTDADPLDHARNLIRYKARRLTRRPEFSISDLPDLEQALTVDVLERLPDYDETKAKITTFVAIVVDHSAASLVRHRKAAMRDPAREECSLNSPVRDGDERIVERHQTTPEASNHHQEKLDLRLDVAELRERYTSGELRLVLDLFSQGGTVNSIAKRLGVSRYQIEQRRAELHALFDDAGLRQFL